jgi:O-antigen ligase
VVGVWFWHGFLLGLIGRASTFNWRLNLWSKLGRVIRKRLFLGFGFGEAFWKNPHSTKLLWKTFHSGRPVFAHNGYVEALLDTGLVGLTLWVVFLFQAATLSLGYFVRQHNLPALFYFSWFVFIAVMNVGNNHLGSYETFTWLLLVIAFSSTLKELLEFQHGVIQTPTTK